MSSRAARCARSRRPPDQEISAHGAGTVRWNLRNSYEHVTLIKGGEVMWSTKWKSASAASLMIGFLAASAGGQLRAEQPGKDVAPPVVRSAGSGVWSAPATWEGGEVPTAGVQIGRAHV